VAVAEFGLCKWFGSRLLTHLTHFTMNSCLGYELQTYRCRQTFRSGLTVIILWISTQTGNLHTQLPFLTIVLWKWTYAVEHMTFRFTFWFEIFGIYEPKVVWRPADRCNQACENYFFNIFLVNTSSFVLSILTDLKKIILISNAVLRASATWTCDWLWNATAKCKFSK
jgi:hypothetical protein